MSATGDVARRGNGMACHSACRVGAPLTASLLARREARDVGAERGGAEIILAALASGEAGARADNREEKAHERRHSIHSPSSRPMPASSVHPAIIIIRRLAHFDAIRMKMSCRIDK